MNESTSTVMPGYKVLPAPKSKDTPEQAFNSLLPKASKKPLLLVSSFTPKQMQKCTKQQNAVYSALSLLVDKIHANLYATAKSIKTHKKYFALELNARDMKAVSTFIPLAVKSKGKTLNILSSLTTKNHASMLKRLQLVLDTMKVVNRSDVRTVTALYKLIENFPAKLEKITERIDNLHYKFTELLEKEKGTFKDEVQELKATRKQLRINTKLITGLLRANPEMGTKAQRNRYAGLVKKILTKGSNIEAIQEQFNTLMSKIKLQTATERKAMRDIKKLLKFKVGLEALNKPKPKYHKLTASIINGLGEWQNYGASGETETDIDKLIATGAVKDYQRTDSKFLYRFVVVKKDDPLNYLRTHARMDSWTKTKEAVKEYTQYYLKYLGKIQPDEIGLVVRLPISSLDVKLDIDALWNDPEFVAHVDKLEETNNFSEGLDFRDTQKEVIAMGKKFTSSNIMGAVHYRTTKIVPYEPVDIGILPTDETEVGKWMQNEMGLHGSATRNLFISMEGDTMLNGKVIVKGKDNRKRSATVKSLYESVALGDNSTSPVNELKIFAKKLGGQVDSRISKVYTKIMQHYTTGARKDHSAPTHGGRAYDRNNHHDVIRKHVFDRISSLAKFPYSTGRNTSVGFGKDEADTLFMNAKIMGNEQPQDALDFIENKLKFKPTSTSDTSFIFVDPTTGVELMMDVNQATRKSRLKISGNLKKLAPRFKGKATAIMKPNPNRVKVEPVTEEQAKVRTFVEEEFGLARPQLMGVSVSLQGYSLNTASIVLNTMSKGKVSVPLKTFADKLKLKDAPVELGRFINSLGGTVLSSFQDNIDWVLADRMPLDKTTLEVLTALGNGFSNMGNYEFKKTFSDASLLHKAENELEAFGLQTTVSNVGGLSTTQYFDGKPDAPSTLVEVREMKGAGLETLRINVYGSSSRNKPRVIVSNLVEPVTEGSKEDVQHWYGLRARPYSIGAQPIDAVEFMDQADVAYKIPNADSIRPINYRHGAVRYEKALSEEDIKGYELIDFSKVAWDDSKAMSKLDELVAIASEYREKYKLDFEKFYDAFLDKTNKDEDNPFYIDGTYFHNKLEKLAREVYGKTTFKENMEAMWLKSMPNTGTGSKPTGFDESGLMQANSMSASLQNISKTDWTNVKNGTRSTPVSKVLGAVVKSNRQRHPRLVIVGTNSSGNPVAMSQGSKTTGTKNPPLFTLPSLDIERILVRHIGMDEFLSLRKQYGIVEKRIDENNANALNKRADALSDLEEAFGSISNWENNYTQVQIRYSNVGAKWESLLGARSKDNKVAIRGSGSKRRWIPVSSVVGLK